MEELYELREQMIMLFLFIVLILTSPLVMISLDFWAGIRKAKKRGIPIYSHKMKRTMDKVSKYYNGIFAMLVLDIIQICMFLFLHIYNGWSAWTFPIFTLVAVVFADAIEIKSIYEPADMKERKDMKEVTELAKAIAEHKSDPKEIAIAIVEYLNQKEEKK